MFDLIDSAWPHMESSLLAKEYPWYTPYQFAGNKPIWAIDLDGLEEISYESTLSNYSILEIEDDQSLLSGTIFYTQISHSEKSFSFNKRGISTRFQFVMFKGYGKSREISNAAETFKTLAYSFSTVYARERYSAKEQFEMSEPEKRTWIEQVNDVAGGAVGKKFRHYASQAYLTAVYGYKGAKDFGDFYERNHENLSTRNYDLINNEKGRQIGLEIASQYDFTTSDGVASFLNEIVNMVRIEDGLDPLTEDNQTFSADSQLVKSLVIKKEDESD